MTSNNLNVASAKQFITVTGTEIAPPAAAATPAFAWPTGTYNAAIEVAIADTTPGAVIYWNIGDSNPTTNSTLYTGSITVSSTEIVNAIAVAPGYSQSAVASATYTINTTLPVAATPTFSEGTNTYTSTQTITISDTTPGATVYFTTDGSTPTANSNLADGPISVSSTETINAIAIATGYTNSAVASATYTINMTMPIAATPTFSEGTNTYTSTQTITISDTTPGATVYFTTDGSTPTANSNLADGPIGIPATETIKAIAIASGYTNSAVATATYTINSAGTPDFAVTASPSSLTITAGKSGTTTVSVTPQNGFASAVIFTCSGLPSGASCSFSPSTVTPSGTTASTTTLTVTTSASMAAVRRNSSPFLPGATLAAALCFLGWKKRRGVQLLILLAVSAIGLGLFTGCGGSSSTTTTKTTPVTSTVTVTGTSGTGASALQNTATFSLTVN